MERDTVNSMSADDCLAFHPQIGELYAVAQERDGLGDGVPSEYLNHVQEDGFYGWPYA